MCAGAGESLGLRSRLLQDREAFKAAAIQELSRAPAWCPDHAPFGAHRVLTQGEAGALGTRMRGLWKDPLTWGGD